MVEIREETEEQHENGQTGPNQSEERAIPRKSPMEFMKENVNEILLFGLRLATIFFVGSYVLPIASPQFQKLAYTKAFAAAAATNAFRLHQRMRAVNAPVLSQIFFSELMMEDSAHYLFYCLVLVMTSPITLALLPITLYALFNIITFISKLSAQVGYVSPTIATSLVQLKQQHSINILSTVALAEIFLLPILVSMIFFGKASLFSPFLYYRFLTMRYVSRRNPYTREMFAQLKILLYSLSNHQSCPNAAKSLIFKFVGFVERLAPQTA